tara:strand:+ start:85 stop:429 length:345 start_codon:yes stop_codon:yes gene_type:complete
MRRLGRFIWLLITTLVVAIAIAFATSNEAMLTLYLWPFDGMLTAPVWLVVISSFIIGGLLSIFLMWAQALAIRARLWNLQLKFNRLEAETAQNIKDQEAKTFISESLRADDTFR